MSADLTVVTPSYRGDFERCRLLCETMDRFCSGYDRHLIVVDDEDHALFSQLAGPTREVIATSALFPPFRIVGRWRGRWYRWRPGIGFPIYGWHLQQLRKIAVTLSQPAARVLCVDSDICFCRPADLSGFATSERVPLFMRPNAFGADQTSHVRWRENAYAALGRPAPALPGDDYIGPLITWEQASVRAMTERIETTHHRPWWEVLARQRDRPGAGPEQQPPADRPVEAGEQRERPQPRRQPPDQPAMLAVGNDLGRGGHRAPPFVSGTRAKGPGHRPGCNRGIGDAMRPAATDGRSLDSPCAWSPGNSRARPALPELTDYIIYCLRA